MQKGNFGFKSPMDSKIAEIFQKQKEIQLKNETTESEKDNKTIDVIQVEPTQMQSGYIGLTGIVIKDNGQITKDDHMAKLSIDANKYKNIVLTEDEAKHVTNQMRRMTTGVNAVVPMVCTGDLCPFRKSCVYYEIGKVPLGKPCQPPGTMVLTGNRGYVAIEDLNESSDLLVNFGASPGGGGTRRIKWSGSKFKLGSRHYSGDLIKIETDSKSHECTDNHICLAKFNNNALDKFIVYMMEKDGKFRIGKTLLYRISEKGKIHSGLMARMRSEEADKAWILGYFNTNTEALLAEEYFSCLFSIPKACFITRPKKDIKYNGLYKWVTQEQLDDHFIKLQKPICEYDKMLRSIGLRYDFPFIDKTTQTDKRAELSLTKVFEIYACNLTSDIMDVIVVENENDKLRNTSLSAYKPIKVSRRHYDGMVYSMNIDKHPTYIANGIITHNCLVESQLIEYWMAQYFEEFDVNPQRITEVHLISELAELDIYEMRVTKYLAENHQALLQEVMTGVDPAGNVISNLEVSRAFDLKERLKKQRMKVLEALMATRKEKIKAIVGVTTGTDTASRISELKEKLEKLNRDVSSVTVEGESVRLS